MNRAAKRHQKKLARKTAKNRRGRPPQALGHGVDGAPARHFSELVQKGAQLHQAGQMREAATIYRQVLDIDPDHADANHLLGVLLFQLGDHGQAVDLISKAIAAVPNQPMYHRNLGIALKDLGQLEEAVASYRMSLAIDPGCAEVHSNLGIALKDLGQLDEAVASYRQALAIQPDLAEAHSNLGLALRELGKLDEAVASCHKALAIKPDHAEAHYNLGLVMLLRGDFPNGFRKYGWRWKTKEFTHHAQDRPEWDGGPFPGKTLLLHAEQGLGDTLQFIRYAPLLRDLGGRIVVECQQPLARLLGSVAGIDVLFPRGVPGGVQPPPFDLQAPLMSLPQLLGTTLETLPAEVPYLSAEPAAVEVWRRRIGGGGDLKVGLVWAGNSGHYNDRNRSIPLEDLRPLLDVPRTRFFALQVGERSGDIEALGWQDAIEDTSPDLNDFADTAAALAALDLLITVDTAPAHLAGALGRPVWLLLPTVPDWRWMMDREDSPWYPTMRLFRQPAPGDWSSAVHRIENELAVLLGD